MFRKAYASPNYERLCFHETFSTGLQRNERARHRCVGCNPLFCDIYNEHGLSLKGEVDSPTPLRHSY